MLTAKEAYNKVQELVSAEIEEQYKAVCDTIGNAVSHGYLSTNIGKSVNIEVIHRLEKLGYVFYDNEGFYGVSWDIEQVDDEMDIDKMYD